MQRKVLLWAKDIDHLILEDDSNFLVGGIHVQMYMWGTIFNMNDWEVFSFTKERRNAKITTKGVTFLFFPEIKLINPFLSFFSALYYALRISPDLIIIRGAARELLLVSILSKLLRFVVIEMFASNSDLEPGKELISSKHDRVLYRWGIYTTRYFVVQNTQQETALRKIYNKNNSILVPQVWVNIDDPVSEHSEREIILWVSNFRTLKRPQWFLNLARENPDFKFVMVGFPSDKKLYESCRIEAEMIPNLVFKGGISFRETNALFKKARLFVCTSNIEGFPNTFIQSWNNNCPVLTTFDPGDVVKNFKLGIYCQDYSELSTGFKKLIIDGFGDLFKANIIEYYKGNLSAQRQYERLIEKCGLE